MSVYCREQGISESRSLQFLADRVRAQGEGAQTLLCKVKSAGDDFKRKASTLMDNPSIDNLKKNAADITAVLGFMGTAYTGYLFTQGGSIAGVIASFATTAGVSVATAQLMGLAVFLLILFCFVYYTLPRLKQLAADLMDNSINIGSF